MKRAALMITCLAAVLSLGGCGCGPFGLDFCGGPRHGGYGRPGPGGYGGGGYGGGPGGGGPGGHY